MAEEAAEEFKNTEIVFLKAGHPPGYCLQSGLFYRSETWFNLIQRDVNGLLDAFVRAYSDLAPSVSLASTSAITMEQGQEEGEVNVGNSSPFQVFKSIWINLGWSKIHLFGTVDGPLRKPWTESVFRAFLSEFWLDFSKFESRLMDSLYRSSEAERRPVGTSSIAVCHLHLLRHATANYGENSYPSRSSLVSSSLHLFNRNTDLSAR